MNATTPNSALTTARKPRCETITDPATGRPAAFPLDADGYPVLRIDESAFPIVHPKMDAATGKHVWPMEFVDD